MKGEGDTARLRVLAPLLFPLTIIDMQCSIALHGKNPLQQLAVWESAQPLSFKHKHGLTTQQPAREALPH